MPPQEDHVKKDEVDKDFETNVETIEVAEFVDEPKPHPQSRPSIPVRVSKFTARNPARCLLGSLAVATLMSYIALGFGKFTIEVDNKGWRSRGTTIANREMQNDLVIRLRDDLFNDVNGSVWEDAENNIVRGFILLEDRSDDDGTCDASSFYATMLGEDNLYAAYQAQNSKSILDPDVLFQICEAETTTHDRLVENKVCGCEGDDDCPTPASLIRLLRLTYNKFGLSCSELKEFYTPAIQGEFTDSLVTCTNEVLDTFDTTSKTYVAPSCPPGFSVSMVDTNFAIDGNEFLTYTTSYFFTAKTSKEALFKVRTDLGYGETDDNLVSVAYDTLWERQTDQYVDSVLFSDMALAMGAILVTVIAMVIHTKSAWLTFFGVLQIIYSVPLGYFVYYFIVGLRFFPFLNFIGIFVAAALGADYIFVTVDKWKNVRLENQVGSIEDIASIALPSAASAMLLTTSTTAVAFFATTICPVTPILCFALFCGLLIVFNYVMNMLLLFPALCLYDRWLMAGSRNIFVNCGCCSKSIFESRAVDEEGEKKESLIHKILSGFYSILHRFRYIVLGACLAAIGVCMYVASTIRLPDNVDVRLLPEDNVYELHYAWKKQMLSFPLFYAGGSTGEATWGLIPVDNGVRNDPDSISKLVLDESFDPSSEDAQTYLLGFCDDLFDSDSDLVLPLYKDYECPINEFDTWLRNQTTLPTPDVAYTSNCAGASSLPVPQDQFHQCIIAWSKLTNNKNVLQKNGKVKILRARFMNSIDFLAPFSEMDKFWSSFEDYMENERNIAPEGVNKMFHTSGSFWWYDTNISMLQTAIGAAAIAVSFSAIIVLISSRSLVLTLFASICITYVLAATTSSLVGFGWDLGFLESVCFAILIGISCDFVIHFGHAYNHLPGDTSRFERTKYAMIHMGPSILAAAFTTFASATVMLFCQVTFFTKFALILLMTILHATAGSFIVYLVLTDCFGPSNPTKLFDSVVKKCFGRGAKEEQDEPKKYMEATKTGVYDLS